MGRWGVFLRKGGVGWGDGRMGRLVRRMEDWEKCEGMGRWEKRNSGELEEKGDESNVSRRFEQLEE